MIELLVVITMVGIISAISAPSWFGYMERQRMNQLRGELSSVLRDAQDRAQNRRESQQVTFSAGGPNTPISVTVRDATASTGGVVTELGSSSEAGNTFALTASTPIVFDHDGRVDVPTPFILKIAKRDAPEPGPGGIATQSCVVVTTLLGGMSSGNNDECETAYWEDVNKVGTSGADVPSGDSTSGGKSDYP